MSVKFYLDGRQNRFGERPVRASFSVKGLKWSTSIGYSVSPEQWADGMLKDSDYVNSRGHTALEIEETLARLQAGILRWEKIERDKPAMLRLQREVRELLQRQDGSVSDMHKIISRFIAEESFQWSESTRRSFRTFQRHILRFDPNVIVTDFDSEGMERWLRYLRAQGLEESTVRKEYQHLRWFLNWTVRKGYAPVNPAASYRPRFRIAGKPVVFLTRQELQRLEQLAIPDNEPELAAARDCFCFCAFTSLRYSDMKQARWSDIDKGVLHVTTQKTFDRLAIDLCPQARDLLRKYPRGTFPDDALLPRLSNQKMNLYLKRLGKMCRIDTPVTRVCYRDGGRQTDTVPKYQLIGTHAARRTFICFALSNGIPPHIVMKWTGHADYKSMRPYIDVAASTCSRAMRRLSSAWKRGE